MYVRKLQARIVKAWKSGCIGKAKSLMWLLTHSFYAKALAVKRVTENKGKYTSGVDRELWSTGNSKYKAIGRLKRRGYQPQPLRRIYIRKPNGKMRPISIPCMIDRAMQALYKMALEPVAETQADRNSYGFRPYRATQDAISQVFTALAQKNRATWVLEGDIKGAFDNVSHRWMLENIPMDRDTLKKILKSGYIDCGKLYPTEEGTAQGGVISPTIFNCVLNGLETEIQKLIPQLRKKTGGNPNINIVRYADDFVVTGANKEILEQEVKPVIEKFLSVRGLQLSQEKTVVTQVKDGFDFLGWNVRKFKGKLIIRPAKKRVKGFLEKVRNIIKDNRAAKQEDLIHKLNPIIRGWANHHKNVCASKTFGYVDYQIWNSLWRWAKRRHPNKSQKWVMKRYFHSIDNRSCAFAKATNKTAEREEVKFLKLAQASDTKIVRHVKVKGGLNPFDENWKEYLEKRHKNHQAAQ
jgi:RNA-directed DNA polymerase